ncbi:MAG: hypothetical protein A2355_15230 [Spirochaetes bacterium RIFOXYB1_FULL_32_8]|nr:MAG: hypothetical protein A2Y30_10080 [Spirochaetes bacterium GWE1_32_154]OHD52159.1 MAG: hypothetical protein A2Y29_16950 [Spirochaetes bacterium GWE2_31_10]OHD78913.1 MAG: hypothetical protein A2355_15230 [Spirochaetes bacterium RIFOXYB1_FULL_32_8]HBD93207.1 hypothetical protein [Spirochaetia bacterium]HBI39322.1 hypothetical protein [Spirochaetia bacterium]
MKYFFILISFILMFNIFSVTNEDRLIVTNDDFDNISWYEDMDNNIEEGSYPSNAFPYNIYLRCKVLKNGDKKLYLYIAGLQTIEKLIINIDKNNYEYISYNDKSGTMGLVDLIDKENELKIIESITKSNNVKLRASNNDGYYTDVILDESQLNSIRNVFRFYSKK